MIQHVVTHGHAPSQLLLADKLAVTVAQVTAGLRALQADHGVVLHPHNDDIWVIHPFSLTSTNFWVEVGRQGWWGNCAWCSLGIAALLMDRGPITISTTLGGHGEQVAVRIIDGRLRNEDLLVHFPIPMGNAWDNVLLTCSTMLFFRDENQIDAWCDRHGMAKGDVQSAGRIWTFARHWYGSHLRPDWRKWTAAEARTMFHDHGLSGPTWDIPESDGRF